MRTNLFSSGLLDDLPPLPARCVKSPHDQARDCVFAAQLLRAAASLKEAEAGQWSLKAAAAGDAGEEPDILQLTEAAARVQSLEAAARAAVDPVLAMLRVVRDKWEAVSDGLADRARAERTIPHSEARELWELAKRYSRAADLLMRRMVAVAVRIPPLPE